MTGMTLVHKYLYCFCFLDYVRNSDKEDGRTIVLVVKGFFVKLRTVGWGGEMWKKKIHQKTLLNKVLSTA